MRGQAISYSKAEMAWLEANRTLVISDYHRVFQDAFGRDDISAANLHSLRKRKGWKVGRAKGRTAGRHLRYTAAEIAWLSVHHTLEIPAYHAAFCAEFGRSDVSAQMLHALRKRKGWRTGRTGQFAKGHVSANKGQTCEEGRGGRHPNARRTQFPKGGRTGKAALNYKPIGYERITKDGYRARKINDDLPLQARWRFVHLIEWEAMNGLLPDGHCLKCRDGDKANTDPSNWVLIPRALLPRINGGRATRGLAYDSAEPEVRDTLLLIARVDHSTRQHRTAADLKATVPAHPSTRS